MGGYGTTNKLDTILVCDDEWLSLKYLLKFVEISTVDDPIRMIAVDSVATLLSSLNIRSIRERTFAVFLDARLPVTDGIVGATLVKERYPEIVVIVISAYLNAEALTAIRQQGLCWRSVLKPCEPKDFLRMIVEARDEFCRRQREGVTGWKFWRSLTRLRKFLVFSTSKKTASE